MRPDGLDGNDLFGEFVTISGNYIVVSTHRDDGADNANTNSGAAYVFKINDDDTITLLETLRLDELARDDYFKSVAISGNYIVVGAYGDDGVDNTKSGSGAVYVFKINDDDTITLLETLRPDELDAADAFGVYVAMDSGYIVVGAYGDDGVATNSGAAYVFKGVE